MQYENTQTYEDRTYGGRFSPQGDGEYVVTKIKGAFSISWKQPGRDYQGPTWRFEPVAKITISDAEIATIEGAPSPSSHLLPGVPPAQAGLVIDFIRSSK